MEAFSIGELARRANVAASTIRYYERIGLLPPAPRVSGRRRYDARTVDQLAIIRLAQDVGFSLTEIDALLYGFPAQTPPAGRWQTFADGKIAELDAVIAQAQRRKAFLQAARECRCPTLNDCASRVSP